MCRDTIPAVIRFPYGQRDLFPMLSRKRTCGQGATEFQIGIQYGGGMGHGSHQVGSHSEFGLDSV